MVDSTVSRTSCLSFAPVKPYLDLYMDASRLVRMHMDRYRDRRAEHTHIVFILELDELAVQIIFDLEPRKRLRELLGMGDEFRLGNAVQLLHEVRSVHVPGYLRMDGDPEDGSVRERRSEFGVVGVERDGFREREAFVRFLLPILHEVVSDIT